MPPKEWPIFSNEPLLPDVSDADAWAVTEQALQHPAISESEKAIRLALLWLLTNADTWVENGVTTPAAVTDAIKNLLHQRWENGKGATDSSALEDALRAAYGPNVNFGGEEMADDRL